MQTSSVQQIFLTGYEEAFIQSKNISYILSKFGSKVRLFYMYIKLTPIPHPLSSQQPPKAPRKSLPKQKTDRVLSRHIESCPWNKVRQFLLIGIPAAAQEVTASATVIAIKSNCTLPGGYCDKKF